VLVRVEREGATYLGEFADSGRLGLPPFTGGNDAAYWPRPGDVWVVQAWPSGKEIGRATLDGARVRVFVARVTH
jgi:hypothetical protein